MAGDIQGRAIFISYRRDDSEGEAGRLYDDLARAYGDDSVFMDVAGIQPGLDFRQAIDANVGACGVLLAVIGPRWASVADAEGGRRLDNTSDFVRIEIASALARKIAVIPVLVHGAKMPPIDQLPDDLKDLRYRNSVELTHARWNSDVALLVAALKSYVTVKKGHETETIHANIPVQLPAPQPAIVEDKGRKFNLAAVAGIVLVALSILMAGILGAKYLVTSREPKQHQHPQAALEAAPVPAETTVSVLVGTWKNSKTPGKEDELFMVTIESSGDHLLVHAQGNCPTGPCDWGVVKATFSGSEAVTEPWNLRNTPKEIKTQRTAECSIRPGSDENQIQITVKNTFHQPDGQVTNGEKELQFVKVTTP
jgi:hypothetical protein